MAEIVDRKLIKELMEREEKRLQEETPIDLSSVPVPANQGLFVVIRSGQTND